MLTRSKSKRKRGGILEFPQSDGIPEDLANCNIRRVGEIPTARKVKKWMRDWEMTREISAQALSFLLALPDLHELVFSFINQSPILRDVLLLKPRMTLPRLWLLDFCQWYLYTNDQ